MKTKTLKIPAELHAQLKFLASTPPGQPINELAAKFVAKGIDAAQKAKAKREGSK